MIEKANAKVNLFLNVVGKREDGYHDLNMVTHPLELHDVLEFELNNRDVLHGSPFEDDIILKAIKLFKETYNIKQHVRITLHKRIPSGAGLGGGSADAAATLKGLNKIFGVHVSLDELATLGLKLGADVPICIYNKPAVVNGIGEVVELLELTKYDVLLAVPNTSISTAEVFKNTSMIQMIYKDNFNMIDAIKNNDLDKIQSSQLNDLQHVTESLSKECKKVSDILIKINAKFMMTGSGSVFYNIYNDNVSMMRDIKELDNHAVKWLHTYLGV